jgi:uncharacterized membrane protein YhaH (DUF805 family)
MDARGNPTYTCSRVRRRVLPWRQQVQREDLGNGVVSGSKLGAVQARVTVSASASGVQSTLWERRMNWYLGVLKKYADFTGRARRKEYWFFVLFNLIISCVLSVIDVFVGTYNAAVGVGILSGLYALGVLIPGIAVTVRRLHDTGRSGWWILIALVPLVGWIVLIIFMFLDSQPGTNAYGPNPKEGEAAIPAPA